MIVLVTGGRDFLDIRSVDFVLSAVHRKLGITLLVHGDAAGADTCCKLWAVRRDIPEQGYPVKQEDWARYGGRAGNIRNVRMFNAAKPRLVVAFPGHSGTFHMTTVARQAGVPVLYTQQFIKEYRHEYQATSGLRRSGL